MKDDGLREFIILAFEGYLKRKEENRLYQRDSQIPQIIIDMYYKSTEEPQFRMIYNNFKRNYLYNESRIDETITEEEKLGLTKVYDYIRNYDFEKKKFNVFVEGMRIHQLLYSECVGSEFGGSLRTDPVVLYNSSVEIPAAEDARAYFQSFITKKLPELDRNNPVSIFDYINSCIYISTELIKAQPFSDGNKRTFRSLLNLMFKQYNLPPVYIKTKEREEYKDALMAALTKRDYVALNQFYYYKICDSIYDLDILPELKDMKREPKEMQKVKTIFENKRI